MDVLPTAFNALARFPQFIVYISIPREGHPGKMDKKPVDYRTGFYPVNPLNPEFWTDANTAIAAKKRFGESYGVGFVFTKDDPFWFLDIDDCLIQVDGHPDWSPLAKALMKAFLGAAMEVSISGKGLHVIGTGIVPKHKMRNGDEHIEFYTEGRFVALTGDRAIGDAGFDCSEKLTWLVVTYFPDYMESSLENDEWTEDAYEGWCGEQDDEKLIEHAIKSKSAAAIFGGKATFSDLWNANEEVLAEFYPASNVGDSYNKSSADMALASHLAYWTGENCERTRKLIERSDLVRDKWDREDYLLRTILKACNSQKKRREEENNQKAETEVAQVTIPIEQPSPLPELPPVMPFDYCCLPITLHDYVKDICDRMQCPPDFVAVAVIVMIAGIIGRKVGIRPKRKDDWTIIVNLWGAIIGVSGIKKTPALNAALWPINKLQTKAFEAYENEKIAYNEKIEINKIKKSLKTCKAKEMFKKDNSVDIAAILKSDEIQNEPLLKRYITNNATYEKLGEILMKNPNGVLVQYDEIIGLLKQLEAPGQDVARSFYLSGANGDTPGMFDRIERGTLHIPAVCLSIIGGIQPGVLSHYVKQAMENGAGADGFLQRFGLMVYPDISSECFYVDRFPDSKAREEMNSLIVKIESLNPISIGAVTDPSGGVPFFHFDNAAQLLYSEWTVKLDKRLLSGEEHPAIVSHFAKYQKLIPSLALIFHLSENGSGAVTEAALKRAIDFGVYLETHARRVYSYATRPDIDAAKLILKRLEMGKLVSPFKSRDLSQRRWAGLDTAEKADAAISVLLDHGHLTKEEIKPGGRPTANYYWIKTV